MYKSTITLIAFILFFNVSAQEVQKFNYQLNFGASISFPYQKTFEYPVTEGKLISSFKPGYNYFIEFMTSYNFNQRMLLNAGASFINNQIQENNISGPFEKDGIIRNSYLGIPIIFDYQVLKKAPLRVGIGIYLNFLLYAKEKGTRYVDTTGLNSYFPDPAVESYIEGKEYDENVSDHFNPLDFGLTAKVEYEFKFTEKFTMLVFSKFNFGLTKIREQSFLYNDWKNYNLLFGLGFKI